MAQKAKKRARLNTPTAVSYVLSVRNVVAGNKFGTECGDARFLRVPAGELPAPSHEIDQRVWLRSVRDLADGQADDRLGELGQVLFFVHGFNNSPADIAFRHQVLQEDLLAEGWRGVVVSFDWPCENSTLNYLEDREDAAATARALVDNGIRLIVEGRTELNCDTNIHLLGHSTGAYVIMEAFAASQKHGDLFKVDWRIGQVAFIAGDVASSSLEATSEWGKPMMGRIMRLTNYSNGFDDVLAVSNAKRFGTEPRAGRVGLPRNPYSKAVNVDCSEYFSGLDPQSQARKAGSWNHSWHIGNPVWTRDLAMTIEGRYDRAVIPTRELTARGLELRDASRPRYEAQWRELAAAGGATPTSL